jgi:hypothetical protein
MPALKVVVAKSRAVVIKDDGQTFVWSDPLTDTFNGLSFAEAENSPDQLKDVIFVGDVLYLFGDKTIEPWPVQEDDDAPFQALAGRVYETGIRDTGCVDHYQSTFAWITDDNKVCIQNPDAVISYPGLQAKIKASETASLWTYIDDGEEFIVVTLDTETWVYYPRSESWSQFESEGEDNWLPRCYGNDLFGSHTDGKVFSFNEDNTDLGGDIERRFRAWVPISSGGIVIHNLLLRTDPGWTVDLVDAPQVEMRRSRDGGYTWSSWRSRSLGTQGNYRTKVEWDCLGMFSRPGAMIEFRVVDAVNFRVSEVLINEPKGGI